MAEQWNPWGGPTNRGSPFRTPQFTGTLYPQPGEFRTTPVGRQYVEDDANRRAAYTLYNQDQGVNPLNNEGAYWDRIFGQVSTGYEAALADDPELTFQSYYGAIRPQLAQQYQLGTPQQRGENPAQYARIARTIARGF